MASLSNSGVTHPPRSNPPLRSSSGPPSPCITPSTETIVVTVNFMWVRPPERAETLRSSDVRRGDRGLDLTLASIEENHGSEAT